MSRDDLLSRLKQYAYRGRLEDPLGKVWYARYQASDQYHRDNSWDWEENRRLLTDFRNMINRYGTYVAMGYAVMSNLVSDLYFQNPDPWVQDKRGNEDLSRILTAVFKAVHAEARTERKMKDALFDTGWAGLGAIWLAFEQNEHEEYEPIYDEETGEPILDDETGETPVVQTEDGQLVRVAQFDEALGDYTKRMVVDRQRIVERRIEPWRMRFDPNGSDWEFEDHRYVIIRFTRSLAECLTDPRFTIEGRQKLITWYAQRGGNDPALMQRISYAMLADSEERDPAYLPVDLIEIWDRVKKQIIWMPPGAMFTLGTHPWPRHFAEKDMFPVRLIAFHREPPTEDGLRGFYPVPIIRMIKPQLYAINRLDALFLEANTHVINKYAMAAGLFTPQELQKLTSDKNREVVTYDPKALSAMFGGVDITPQLVKAAFGLIPQGEIKEMRHLEGIQHELDMIAQIIGQAPGDRGGLAEAGSATEALGLQQRLQQRLAEMRNEAGQHYKAVTEIIYLILKCCQTLPIRYQMVTEYDQKVWGEFTADRWEDLDLHFDFAVGSQAPRTRQSEIALRQQVFQVVMPYAQELGDRRLMLFMTKMLAEPLEIRGLDAFLTDEASEIAKQLLMLNMAIRDGRASAGDMQVAAQKQELESALIQSVITTPDMMEVAESTAQPGEVMPQQGGGGGGMGSQKNPVRSAGQKAAAMAAAGTIGGMA